MSAKTYYKILIIYGFILLITSIVLLDLIMLPEYMGGSVLSSGQEDTILHFASLLVIAGLFLIYPYLFKQIRRKVGEKLILIPAIGFIALGVACLVISLIADTFVFTKYIGYPVLSLISFIYGISFLRNKSIIKMEEAEKPLYETDANNVKKRKMEFLKKHRFVIWGVLGFGYLAGSLIGVISYLEGNLLGVITSMTFLIVVTGFMGVLYAVQKASM